jgi:hypothetical protein
MAERKFKINRAPVLTLWAVIVAERLGYKREEALTLGKALAGLNAQSKGQNLGIFQPSSAKPAKASASKPAPSSTVELMSRQIRVYKTRSGLRAADKDKAADPASVERYLTVKFGDALPAAQEAMKKLAQSYPPKELSAHAFALYEVFRPEIPSGTKGWGAKGELDLARIEELAKKHG